MICQVLSPMTWVFVILQNMFPVFQTHLQPICTSVHSTSDGWNHSFTSYMNNCTFPIKTQILFEKTSHNPFHFRTCNVLHTHQNTFINSTFRPRIRNWDKSPSRRLKYHTFWPPLRRISERFITVWSNLVRHGSQLHGWEHSFGVSNATVLGVDGNCILSDREQVHLDEYIRPTQIFLVGEFKGTFYDQLQMWRCSPENDREINANCCKLEAPIDDRS